MDRRRFLAIGGVSSLALVVPGVWGTGLPSNQGVLARPELLTMLGDPAHVRELGRCYRSAFPKENSREALIAALHRDLAPGPPSRPRVQERIRADFGAERTVLLEGWVLAVTEARQCALLSLS